MDQDRMAAGQFLDELAHRLEEGQALDVADGAADLAEHEIGIVGIRLDVVLDDVGDMGNDLDRAAQVVAAPLPADDVGIDPPAGHRVAATRRDAREAFVVAKIEVGFGAVVGDEDLAVLVRAHGARIDVEIGVELAQAHAIAARLEQGSQCSRRQALTEG